MAMAPGLSDEDKRIMYENRRIPVSEQVKTSKILEQEPQPEYGFEVGQEIELESGPGWKVESVYRNKEGEQMFALTKPGRPGMAFSGATLEKIQRDLPTRSLNSGQPLGFQHDAIAAAETKNAAEHAIRTISAEKRSARIEVQKTKALEEAEVWLTGIGVDHNSIKVTIIDVVPGPDSYHAYNAPSGYYDVTTSLSWAIDGRDFFGKVAHEFYLTPSYHPNHTSINVSIVITTDSKGTKENKPANTLEEIGQALIEEKRLQNS